MEQADCLALVAVPWGELLQVPPRPATADAWRGVGKWQERAGLKVLGRAGNGRLAGRLFVGGLAAGIALASEAGTGWRSGGAPFLVG